MLCSRIILANSCEITRLVTRNVSMRANKHWDPKWKRLRAAKVIKVELPDYHKKKPNIEQMSKEEIRSYYKKEGIAPHRPWKERELLITSTSSIFEPYIPPEGDGKMSTLNSEGAKQKMEWLKKKTTSWRSLRELRKYDEDFDLYPDFVDEAQEIYIKVHEILTKGFRRRGMGLLNYVTERAYPELLHNTERKTIRWNFIKSLEPPRVSHIRHTTILDQTNLFAQITVRFHTQQKLAIYDRFGRLIHGSEIIPKDVLEYVVFERHMANKYGKWRIHAKIIPEWMPPCEPILRTFVKEDHEDESQRQRESDPDMAKAGTLVPGAAVTVPGV